MEAYISHPMPEELFPTPGACFAASTMDGDSEFLRPRVDSNLFRGVAAGITLELCAGFFFYGLWALYSLAR